MSILKLGNEYQPIISLDTIMVIMGAVGAGISAGAVSYFQLRKSAR